MQDIRVRSVWDAEFIRHFREVEALLKPSSAWGRHKGMDGVRAAAALAHDYLISATAAELTANVLDSGALREVCADIKTHLPRTLDASKELRPARRLAAVVVRRTRAGKLASREMRDLLSPSPRTAKVLAIEHG